VREKPLTYTDYFREDVEEIGDLVSLRLDQLSRLILQEVVVCAQGIQKGSRLITHMLHKKKKSVKN